MNFNIEKWTSTMPAGGVPRCTNNVCTFCRGENKPDIRTQMIEGFRDVWKRSLQDGGLCLECVQNDEPYIGYERRQCRTHGDWGLP